MTTITRNLPPFIKELGISIVGKKCYTSLVENLDVQDIDCLKYAVSKGLGIGIVAGGSVMKVPQMLLILNAGSAEGLSLTAYVLETLSYAITLTYSIKNRFPFSTYGENLFLTLQDILITLLIIAYSPQAKPKGPAVSSTKPRDLTLALLATSGVAYALTSLPLSTLTLLQTLTLPLSLFSKLPQIAQNHRAQSTGQLSTVAVVAQIAGCLARLFTTATEVGDTLVAAGFALALVLNMVLGVQMWMYWGNKVSKKQPEVKVQVEDVNVDKKENGKTSAYEPLASTPQPVHRFATPPPRSFSPASAQRKWARKTVD